MVDEDKKNRESASTRLAFLLILILLQQHLGGTSAMSDIPASASPAATNIGRRMLQTAVPPCPPPGVLISYNFRLYCITCTVDQELITGDDFPWCRAVDCSTRYGGSRPIWNITTNLCQTPLLPSPYAANCLPGFICTSPPPPRTPSLSPPPPIWFQPQFPPPNLPLAPSRSSPFPLPTSPSPPAGSSFQPSLPGSPFSPTTPSYPLQPPSPQAQTSTPPPPPQPVDCGPHGTPAAPDSSQCVCSQGWTNDPNQSLGQAFRWCTLPEGAASFPTPLPSNPKPPGSVGNDGIGVGRGSSNLPNSKGYEGQSGSKNGTGGLGTGMIVAIVVVIVVIVLVCCGCAVCGACMWRQRQAERKAMEDMRSEVTRMTMSSYGGSFSVHPYSKPVGVLPEVVMGVGSQSYKATPLPGGSFPLRYGGSVVEIGVDGRMGSVSVPSFPPANGGTMRRPSIGCNDVLC